jgi:signal peptidase I
VGKEKTTDKENSATDESWLVSGCIGRWLRKEKKSKKKKSVVREYVEAIVVAVLLALVIRQFVVQAFRIPSGSMEDTLLVGDFLLANKFIYGPTIPFTDIRLPGIRKPRTGDVVIFKFPRDPKKDFIKRVIATEGQRVEVKDKVVYVDGETLPFPPESKFTDRRILSRGISRRDNYGPVTVPLDAFFVMGDNRDNSQDGRYWGFVPMKNLKGKAMILYWSWNKEAPLWDVFHKVRWGRLAHLIR